MKAITIWQPWATLLACGAKQFETRSWATNYRGSIAIHAAAKSINSVIKECFPLGEWNYHPDYEAKRRFLNAVGFSLLEPMNELPLGAVIGTAELINCWYIVHNPGTNIDVAKHIPIGAESMTTDKHAPDFSDYIVPTETELLFGDWTPGRYAWELSNVKILDNPIPAKGQQGLWNWDDAHG